MPRVLRLALALLFLAACGGSAGEGSDDSGSPLADLALRPDEAPAGMELDEDASGQLTFFRDVLPPQSDIPQVEPVPKSVRRSFLGGYHARYVGDEESEGRSLSSSVLQFTDPANAASFLDYLREVQSQTSTREVGTVEILETPGLGEEGYGWHRAAPGAETSGCSWRRGDLVVTLTLGGSAGEASPEMANDLAGTVDARLS